MTDREKLIELLYHNIFPMSFERHRIEYYADSLLDDGIIVPPCKPGDTVYMPWEWNGTKGVAILTVTHIIINDSHSYIKAPLYSDDEDYSRKYGYGRFEFDDFGKTVFLTPEEAEKALAEREAIQNDNE